MIYAELVIWSRGIEVIILPEIQNQERQGRKFAI
jgi:hypothetical protein